MSKRPPHKKTVSFQDSRSSPAAENAQYNVLFSLKLMPLHLVLMCFSLFSSDLSPSNVVPLLTFYLCLLVGAQLVYSVMFNSSIFETRKAKQRQLKFNVLKEYNLLFIALLICSIGVVPLYVVLVLFGAPFTTFIRETLCLACHMSALSYPLVVSALKIGTQPMLYTYFVAIALGSWLGAIAIPLDWDRPWQNWPLPILGGAYVGAIVGYTLGGFV